MTRPLRLTVSILTLAASVGCVAESHRRVEPQQVAASRDEYHGPKVDVVIGKFANKTNYMNGIFSDGSDPIGGQARQILKTHLSQSGRFSVLDRVNLDEIAQEAEFSGRATQIEGGEIIVTGAVTEFGRKETGGHALGGILGRSRSQIAYCKVAVSVVDTETSRVLTSAQGAGEYRLTNAEVLGFGGSAGYDATLTDKVLNLAMMEVIDDLVTSLENGEWER